MYITKLTDNQIKELIKTYADGYTEITITRHKDNIDVDLIYEDLPESYILYDYTVEVYDWDDSDTDCLKKYREKMLEFFGNQYAIDYLLN